MIIGITGSFGSGKTTAANMFRRYGFKVIDADKLYHENFYKNHPLRNKIKKEFGTSDRSKLKKIVFSDYSKLRKLNRLTHPVIIEMMKKEIQKIKDANKKIPLIKKTKKNKIQKNYYNKKFDGVNIAVDIPLLFEAKMERLFDKIIVVKCDKKSQIKRILSKNKKYTKKEVEQIIKSQMPLKGKIKKADFVINNNNIIKNTENQIKNIVDSLQQKP